MSFTEQRDKFNKGATEQTFQSNADYQKQYLSTQRINFLDSLDGNYISHLYDDLISENVTLDYKFFLREFYRNSEESAKECLEIANYTSDIYGNKIKAWTDAALKCFDNFLFKLINETLKEKIKKVTRNPKERDVYWHLIKKGGEYQIIGQAFDTVYLQRNEMTHVQVENIEGVRKPINISKKRFMRYKLLILKNFHLGLSTLKEKV